MFIVSRIIVIPCILLGSLLLFIALPLSAYGQETYLGTPCPGPYTLFMDWGNAESARVSMEFGPLSQDFQAAPGWHAAPLPESVTPLSPLNWNSEAQLQPRFLLHAAGDPLKLRLTPTGLVPLPFTGPTGTPPTESVSFPLPALPAGKVLVTLKHPPQSTQQSDLLHVSVGAVAATVRPAPDTTETRVILATPNNTSGGPPRFTLRRLGPTWPDINHLSIQVLAIQQVIWPFQDGLTVFQTANEHGKPQGHIVRWIRRGAAQLVEMPKSLIAKCVQTLPMVSDLRSSLQDTPIFIFEGFHQREPSPTAPRDQPFQRWTASEQARIILTVPPNHDAEVRLRFQAACPAELLPAHAELRVGSSTVPMDFADGYWEGRVPLPAVARDGEQVVLDITSRLWRPSEVLDSQDHRELGLLLDSLMVVLEPPDPEIGEPGAPGPRF